MRHTTKIIFALGAMLFASASSLGACGSDASDELNKQGDSLRGKGKKAPDCGGLAGQSCAKGEFCDYPEAAICGAADATGVCSAIPAQCPEIYAPVCGCDDKTYGNACEANRASVSVVSTGECGGSVKADAGKADAGKADAASPASRVDSGVVSPAKCGGIAGLKCGSDAWCNYEVAAGGTGCDGIADASGVCQPAAPLNCLTIYNPVCGCDGKTYSNDCGAHSAGVSVAKKGECGVPPKPVGKTCGGIANLQCASGEWCNYEVEAGGTGCVGIADKSGVCQPSAPRACTSDFNPVCGCDGKTYSNACGAHGAGASIATKGECAVTDAGAPPPAGGKVCGGLLGGQCATGEFCDFYKQTNDCGLADGTGVCRTRPEICTLQYDPVCGCDGKTYGTACGANSAGVAVASKGECAGAPPATTGSSCDPRAVLCRMAPPECPAGTVPSVEGRCWGDCVAIEQCKCSGDPLECPQNERYSCHRAAGHCGPYVN